VGAFYISIMRPMLLTYGRLCCRDPLIEASRAAACPLWRHRRFVPSVRPQIRIGLSTVTINHQITQNPLKCSFESKNHKVNLPAKIWRICSRFLGSPAGHCFVVTEPNSKLFKPLYPMGYFYPPDNAHSPSCCAEEGSLGWASRSPGLLCVYEVHLGVIASGRNRICYLAPDNPSTATRACMIHLDEAHPGHPPPGLATLMIGVPSIVIHSVPCTCSSPSVTYSSLILTHVSLVRT
jgi:hypothetical protein